MRPFSTTHQGLGPSPNAPCVARKSVRTLYHRLVTGRPSPGTQRLDEEHETTPTTPPFGPFDDLDSLWAALLSLRDEEADGKGGLDEDRVLLAYAPTALLEGCWLRGLAGVRRADAELGAACIEAFFLGCGEGDSAAHRGNLYRATLAARGLGLPEIASPTFVEDTRLCDADFAPALIALRLGQCQSDALLPEILGFHAAATLFGPPALVRAAGARQGRYFRDHEPGALIAKRARELARRCLEAYASEAAPTWRRVARGASMHLQARQTWVASLRPSAEPSPWGAMLALVEAKARHAFGYHGGVRLAGRSLDAWFDPAKLDARAFLDALARSRWITPGKPDESALVTSLVQFGGPMFGVFTDAEIESIRAWVRALVDAPSLPPPIDAPRIDASPRPASRTGERIDASMLDTPSAPRPSDSRLPLPQLYCRLLNPERGKKARAPAEAHALHLFTRGQPAATPEKLAARGLWPWSSSRFEAWVEARLREQVFEERKGEGEGGLAGALRRDDLVWLLTQLAPAALVDGAWLQGVAAPDCFHTPISALLFRIYRDELGAGVPHQHHGNVLRRALSAQGIELPPCDSAAFAAWPGFLPEAFSLPTLWLSTAAGGAALLPELLGLNLAVEMAGLGHTYARAVTLLRKHGIDPYFFELHNTIDNPATGHTAWSVQAVNLYMNDLVAKGDAMVVERAWSRLWRGHAAYGLASQPLVRAVALRLGPRLGARWLQERLGGRWLRERLASRTAGGERREQRGARLCAASSAPSIFARDALSTPDASPEWPRACATAAPTTGSHGANQGSRWPPAGSPSSTSRAGANRSLMQAGRFGPRTTASSSTTKSSDVSSPHGATGCEPAATPNSGQAFTSMRARARSSERGASSPSPSGAALAARCCSVVTASASARSTTPRSTGGCSGRPK